MHFQLKLDCRSIERHAFSAEIARRSIERHARTAENACRSIQRYLRAQILWTDCLQSFWSARWLELGPLVYLML